MELTPKISKFPSGGGTPIKPGETFEVHPDDPKWHDDKFLETIADVLAKDPQSPVLQPPIIGKNEQYPDLYVAPMSIDEIIYATAPSDTPYALLFEQHGTRATKKLTQQQIKELIYRDLEKLANLNG